MKLCATKSGTFALVRSGLAGQPEELYSKSEMRQLVERGILALPANYRVVVMLRDIQQLSTDELPRQLGLSVPAVRRGC